jgi:hypothetical protein
MRKKLKYLLLFGLTFISCETKEKSLNEIDFKNLSRLTILKGYPEEVIVVDTTISKEILLDIIKAKEVQGPIKYQKKYRFVIQYYKSKEDLVLKFKIR